MPPLIWWKSDSLKINHLLLLIINCEVHAVRILTSSVNQSVYTKSSSLTVHEYFDDFLSFNSFFCCCEWWDGIRSTVSVVGLLIIGKFKERCWWWLAALRMRENQRGWCFYDEDLYFAKKSYVKKNKIKEPKCISIIFIQFNFSKDGCIHLTFI